MNLNLIKEDIDICDDGYNVYWTDKGYLTSRQLRQIADYLDKINEAWDKDFQEYGGT